MMPILILAAGASARMRGVDKLLLDIDGVPLLRRQAKVALEVSKDVRIALPKRPHARYGALDGLAVRKIEVADAADGINSSLRALFGRLRPEVSHAMLMLADMPDITSDDLRQVMDACADHPDALIWRAATPAGQGGHPMIFARKLFLSFQGLSGDIGGQVIVSRAGTKVHLVPLDDDRARHDLDTPEDWAAWQAARNGEALT